MSSPKLTSSSYDYVDITNGEAITFTDSETTNPVVKHLSDYKWYYLALIVVLISVAMYIKGRKKK